LGNACFVKPADPKQEGQQNEDAQEFHVDKQVHFFCLLLNMDSDLFDPYGMVDQPELLECL
jgi:hypothetical protein